LCPKNAKIANAVEEKEDIFLHKFPEPVITLSFQPKTPLAHLSYPKHGNTVGIPLPSSPYTINLLGFEENETLLDLLV